MTQEIESLIEIASNYDAIVFDQWGVLHDGAAPYPGAVEALETLKSAGHRLAVLSNSGKRSAPNEKRIENTGYPSGLFEIVMTSGEALWRDTVDRKITASRFFPIERKGGDAAEWALGLDLTLEARIQNADAVLLMGLPDGDTVDDWHTTLKTARERDLVVYCSNPDKASPRGKAKVISPGALAEAYEAMGGSVVFYGKPHAPIFDAVARYLGSTKLLMIGDSFEHDIAGANAAGWDSVFVQAGLYSSQFSDADTLSTVKTLCDQIAAPYPTFTLGALA